jgi:hypothetical protein
MKDHRLSPEQIHERAATLMWVACGICIGVGLVVIGTALRIQ